MSSRIKHIALTGIIGSGKSMVAELFRKSGCKVLDADQIARALMEKGAAGWLRIKDEFGTLYFNDDETLDRPKLRREIFKNAELRRRIDSTIHPLIRNEISALLDKQENEQSINVVELPLLFEVGWQDDFDLTIVVSADERTCLDRLIERDGVDEQSGREALNAQMGLAKKIELADYHVDNSRSIEETKSRYRKLSLR